MVFWLDCVYSALFVLVLVPGCESYNGYVYVPEIDLKGNDLAWYQNSSRKDNSDFFVPRIRNSDTCRPRPPRYAYIRKGLLLIVGYTIKVADVAGPLLTGKCYFMAFDPLVSYEYKVVFEKGTTDFVYNFYCFQDISNPMGPSCLINRINDDYLAYYCQRKVYLMKVVRDDVLITLVGVDFAPFPFYTKTTVYNMYKALTYKVSDVDYLLVAMLPRWLIHFRITPTSAKIVNIKDENAAVDYIRSNFPSADFLWKCRTEVVEGYGWSSGPFCEFSYDSNNKLVLNFVEGAFNQNGCLRVRRGLVNYDPAPQLSTAAAPTDPMGYVIETFNMHTRKVLSRKCFFTSPSFTKNYPIEEVRIGNILPFWVGDEESRERACRMPLEEVFPQITGGDDEDDECAMYGECDPTVVYDDETTTTTTAIPSNTAAPTQPAGGGGGNAPTAATAATTKSTTTTVSTTSTSTTTTTTIRLTTTTQWAQTGRWSTAKPVIRNSTSVCQTALFPESAKGNFRIVGMEPDNTPIRGIYGFPRLAVYNGVDSVPEFIGDPDGYLEANCYVEENRVATGVAHFGLRPLDYSHYVVFCNKGYGREKDSTVILYKYDNQKMEHLANKTFQVNANESNNHFIDNRGVMMLNLNNIFYFVQMRPCVLFSVSGHSTANPQIDVKSPNNMRNHLCTKEEIQTVLGTAVDYNVLTKCAFHSCQFEDNQINVGAQYDPRSYYTEDLISQHPSFVTGKFGCYVSTFERFSENGKILNGYTFDYDPKYRPASNNTPCFTPFPFSSNFVIMGKNDSRESCADPSVDSWDFGGQTVPVMPTTPMGSISEIPEITVAPSHIPKPEMQVVPECPQFHIDTVFGVAMAALALGFSILLFAVIVYLERFGRRNYEEHKRLHESKYGSNTTATETTTASTHSQVSQNADIGPSLLNHEIGPNTAAFYAEHPPPGYSPSRSPAPFSPKQPKGKQKSSGPQPPLFTSTRYFSLGTPKFSANSKPKPTFSTDGELIYPAQPTL